MRAWGACGPSSILGSPTIMQKESALVFFIKSVFFLAIIYCGLLFAEDKPIKKKPTKFKRVTVINFATELMEGSIKKPNIKYFTTLKKKDFKSLIKIRKNFDKKINKSGD